MNFTVTHPGGTKDAEFQDYVRLLRQTGVDLGHLPRVSEPGTRRRWLHAWNTAKSAQQFADELKRRTGDDAWAVVEVPGPPSEGPLGPIFIELSRRSDGLLFALHPLSRALIQSAFPEAVPLVTNTFIGLEQWSHFLRARGGLDDLVRQIAPNLTGLTPHEFEELGYAVIDKETSETVVFVPPALVNQG